MGRVDGNEKVKYDGHSKSPKKSRENDEERREERREE